MPPNYYQLMILIWPITQAHAIYYYVYNTHTHTQFYQNIANSVILPIAILILTTIYLKNQDILRAK